MVDIEQIITVVRQILPETRFQHTQRVVQLANSIVEKKKENNTLNNQINKEKLIAAAYLHDIAKPFNPETIQKHGINEQETQQKFYQDYPLIWHAFIAPILIEKLLHISDPEIFAAIKNHTTGQKIMDELSKLLFVSDFGEPGRKMKLSIWIVQLAIENLDEAIYVISKHTIAYLKKKNIKIHKNTLECYTYYKKELERDTLKQLDFEYLL